MKVRFRNVFGIATLQDAGRLGYRKYGVPIGGAFDRESLCLANALVGNAPSAACVEFALGTLELEVLEPGSMAFVGAAESISINGDDRKLGVVSLEAGDTVIVHPPKRGLRTYLATCGGFEARLVLGSVSGAVIERGCEASSIEQRSVPGSMIDQELSSLVPRPLRVVVGTADPSWTEPEYAVGRSIDRVGLRLEGPRPMIDASSGRSEPSVFGAVQVTEDRSLIVHGPDGPTIGGYRIVGCVVRSDLDRLGQLAPGDRVTFEPVSVERAKELWAEARSRSD